jgi:hypothetical protein
MVIIIYIMYCSSVILLLLSLYIYILHYYTITFFISYYNRLSGSDATDSLTRIMKNQIK